MKRTLIFSILFSSILASAFSQTDSTRHNLYSKKGFYYFPEKGDWTISVDATPFLSYIGSLIGSKEYYDVYYYDGWGEYISSNHYRQESPSFAFTAQNPGTLFFKYFYAEDKAYRMKFLFGYTSEKDILSTQSFGSDEAYLKQSGLAVGLFFGQEYYMPIKSRIRGYYGYEVGGFLLPFRGGSYIIDNQTFIGNIEYVNKGLIDGDFEEKGGSTYGFSANGFLGAKWFFAPKVAIGGELGLGLKYSTMTEREYTSSDGVKVVIDSGMNKFELSPFASGNLILHIFF
ncbi:hypothetical protein [Alkalitalea saponilacus]|uniref:Outer membrane protein beta-barrel domain-containing protein n=1 Tax=Alkalitalea saponilacus TaxID=889453 RepID=A0A1T5HTH3_9BACT|nr:hypothetical protein [Alkalitalea saponilacus]ASB49198.1 hypothetical protein CDL62_08620 [Alkalitalea saponilacus]SKC23976.1 hypothetical protein SAMN03080601_03264 [Alkalitalea saponilacus]